LVLGDHASKPFDFEAILNTRTSPPANALIPRPGQPSRFDLSYGEQAYEVVYEDADGEPMLAFVDGHWFDVTSYVPQPISVRRALRRDPAWSGAVVQTVCLWMRRHPDEERAFELATELALAVGELARDAL
jgi:hypothetical protein